MFYKLVILIAALVTMASFWENFARAYGGIISGGYLGGIYHALVALLILGFATGYVRKVELAVEEAERLKKENDRKKSELTTELYLKDKSKSLSAPPNKKLKK